MQDIAGLSRNYKYVLFFDGWIFSGLYRGQKLRKMVSNIRGGEMIFFALLSGAFQVKDSDKGGGPMANDFG